MFLRPALRSFAALLLALAASGCAYRGGDIGNPVERKFSWFSFVEGDDLRASCGPGALDRFRFVQNARYQEQVRIYEVTRTTTRGGHPFRARALTDVPLVGIEVGPGGIEGPWAGRTSRATLSDAQYQDLLDALSDSGFFETPPAGLRLPSDLFFWTVAACVDGRYRFNAWLYPSERYARLRFPAVLYGLDRTGVPPNPPRYVVSTTYSNPSPTDSGVLFTLEVGRNGLVGGPLF